MRGALILAATSVLSACATPARMHDEAQLNCVALGCGLALGELIQDESEKKLLLMIRQEPRADQRLCVAKWARKNGLRAVFVENIQFPGGGS
jgi:hypothetical protein